MPGSTGAIRRPISKRADNSPPSRASCAVTAASRVTENVINFLTKNLTTSGIHHDVHIAVIEQASTPDQQTSCCNIYDYESLYANKTYASPSLIIIGKVAALHTKFAWFNERTETGFFFKELGTSDLNLPLNSLNRKAC